jgi:transposase
MTLFWTWIIQYMHWILPLDICLSIFPWATFRTNMAAVKLLTLMDLRGNIPVFIDITEGATNDVNTMDLIDFEPGAFYVMDKAYTNFACLFEIELYRAFFVIRAKDNQKISHSCSRKGDKAEGLKCDQIIKLSGIKTPRHYHGKLRKIKYYETDNDLLLVFLTNNFNISALDICMLY